MLVSANLVAHFSRVCAYPAAQPPISATHPRLTILELTLGDALVVPIVGFEPRAEILN